MIQEIGPIELSVEKQVKLGEFLAELDPLFTPDIEPDLSKVDLKKATKILIDLNNDEFLHNCLLQYKAAKAVRRIYLRGLI